MIKTSKNYNYILVMLKEKYMEIYISDKFISIEYFKSFSFHSA